jgi:hypothetical protein
LSPRNSFATGSVTPERPSFQVRFKYRGAACRYRATGALDDMPAFSTASPVARPLPWPSLSLAAFLRSVMPALDGAYGLDVEPDLPEDIAILVARLMARLERMSDAAPALSVVPMPRPDCGLAPASCDEPGQAPDAEPMAESLPVAA